MPVSIFLFSSFIPIFLEFKEIHKNISKSTKKNFVVKSDMTIWSRDLFRPMRSRHFVFVVSGHFCRCFELLSTLSKKYFKKFGSYIELFSQNDG